MRILLAVCDRVRREIASSLRRTAPRPMSRASHQQLVYNEQVGLVSCGIRGPRRLRLGPAPGAGRVVQRLESYAVLPGRRRGRQEMGLKATSCLGGRGWKDEPPQRRILAESRARDDRVREGLDDFLDPARFGSQRDDRTCARRLDGFLLPCSCSRDFRSRPRRLRLRGSTGP